MRNKWTIVFVSIFENGNYEYFEIAICSHLGDSLEFSAYMTDYAQYFCNKEKLTTKQYCYVVEGDFLNV